MKKALEITIDYHLDAMKYIYPPPGRIDSCRYQIGGHRKSKRLCKIFSP